MSECKHGLKHGCAYCHVTTTGPTRSVGSTRSAAPPKRQSRSARLSEQMNDRMTALKQRLRQLRGE